MSGMRTVRTIVLVSRDNFVWPSMQEIIPMLEQVWLGSARRKIHEVATVNIDGIPLKSYLPQLLTADNIVLTSFTHKLCRIPYIVREQFGVDARFFIHLHHLATIACWPYHVWGSTRMFRSGDVFISSSAPDAKTLKHTFRAAKSITLPFTLPEAQSLRTTLPSARKLRAPIFLYSGRISAQKNLHTLILTFRRLLLLPAYSNARLIIYGADDNLGSPNMGIKQSGYEEFLRSLTKRLKIEDQVIFAGHLSRTELHDRLKSTPHIFISPSLHSDENFGMAAYRSLCMGQSAVLSFWGGHQDLVKTFPKQTFPVKVLGGSSGPWLSSKDLLRAMILAAASRGKGYRSGIPKTHQLKTLSNQILNLANKLSKNSEPLKLAPVAKRVLKKQKFFSKKSRHPTKIFDSYRDPDAALFFASYGMKRVTANSVGRLKKEDLIVIHPWGRVSSNQIEIDDPHRGRFFFQIKKTGNFRAIDYFENSMTIPKSVAVSLLSDGFAELG